jgi:mRNA interferase RelE/StbE
LAWRIEFDEPARKELEKLDRQVARRIVRFLRDRAAVDPRAVGRALQGPQFGEFWKYRIGDYRVIARIEDDRLQILVVRIGHRGDIYRSR